MSPYALLLEIDCISEVLFIINHFEMGILGKAIGNIGMLILIGLIVNFKLNGVVNGRKPCNSLITLPYCFFLFSEIPDRFILTIPIG